MRYGFFGESNVSSPQHFQRDRSILCDQVLDFLIERLFILQFLVERLL